MESPSSESVARKRGFLDRIIDNVPLFKGGGIRKGSGKKKQSGGKRGRRIHAEKVPIVLIRSPQGGGKL